jgi:uncharacterized protein with GYD domain
MALYLIRLKQSPAAFQHMIEHPEDRRPAFAKTLEASGGELHGAWYAFGEYDVVALVEMPDNVAMASVISSMAASGAWSGGETTVLLSIEEMLDAFKKAQAVDYQPPGG